MATSLSYCAHLVHAQDRDRFLAALFVPQPHREALLAVCALNIELAHVHHAVSEEMIGHIRYAWWQETLEAGVRQGHPVIEALVPVMAAGIDVLPLVAIYRDAFPEMPEITNLLDAISLQLIRALSPAAEPHWRKAQTIIANHRKRFGAKLNNWLALKLLIG